MTPSTTCVGIEQADACHLLRRERDRLRVRHLPDVVALEAEVLDAEAGVARHDELLAPGAEVLDAAGTCPGIVDVDPVVRERLRLGRHQRDQAEVAVAQPARRVDDVGRRRRVEREDEVGERDARQHAVDGMLRLLPVRARR